MISSAKETGGGGHRQAPKIDLFGQQRRGDVPAPPDHAGRALWAISEELTGVTFGV